MKNFILSFISLLFLLIFFSTCEPEESNLNEPEESNPYGSGNGQYTFWIQSDLRTGSITVNVDNQSIGTITHYHSNGVNCGNGDANVIKKAGSYNWNATSTNGTKWSGTINVVENECQTLQLTGNGGGSGGGGNCNWNSAVDCVQVTKLTGNRCGYPESVDITCKNICNQKLKIFICVQRTDGTWSGYPDGTFSNGVAPGGTSNNYVCKGTGQYKIFAMPITSYNSNNCGWPSCK